MPRQPGDRRRRVQGTLLTLGVLALAAMVDARLPYGDVARAEGGTTNLPYLINNDSAGNQWRIFPGGWMQEQGSMPVYGQGAMLLVDGNQVNQNNNVGRIDEKSGELIIDCTTNNGLAITRHVLFNKEQNFCRYIDVFTNSTAQDLNANITIQTNLNYGVNSAQMLADPKKKDHSVAWVAQTGANVSAVEMFAGKGSKVAPTINWQQGNNMVQAGLAMTIPAGKSQAFMHLHANFVTGDAASQFVLNLKEPALLRSIPIALRRLIVNFAGAGNFIGEIEVLRGDLLDVVELRGGDQYKGNLLATAYDLQTFYGPVALPVDRVVGLISVGQFRPRQLVILADGQAIGGQLKQETVGLQLSSGQTLQIPLSQVTRIGYRKRAGEPEEWNFEGRALLALRTGERVGIRLPKGPLDVMTRYGKLSIEPSQVAYVALQSDDTTVHEIFLTDGSKFSGLVSTEAMQMELEAAKGQVVEIPTREISRIQLAGKASEVTDLTPTLKFANGDLLVGTLGGKLKLDTAFDVIDLNAAEIKSLGRLGETGPDVQVSLWDGTTLSGHLESQTVDCQLRSGTQVSVPVSLLTEYVQPRPQPSPAMLTRIKAAIKDLNSDDWKQRDHAAAMLLSMGPVAAGALQDLRANQSEEAQKAIDNVLKEFDKQRRPATAAPAPPVAPVDGPVDEVAPVPVPPNPPAGN